MQISTTWEQIPVIDENVRIDKWLKDIFNSSHDMEQDGIQFLRIGVTLAKLIMPSIKSLQDFYEMHLCIKFL